MSVNIIGAGLAGLSTAIHLAKAGIKSNLISLQASERAQSVLAEGGINAALDTMGEGDSQDLHFEDTVRSGCGLADPEAVKGLTEHAPEIVNWLMSLGVPFHKENGKLVLRAFGGQSKRRTAYVKSSTGKAIVSALIDEARRWEVAGLIKRYPHHEFIRLVGASGGESEAADGLFKDGKERRRQVGADIEGVSCIDDVQTEQSKLSRVIGVIIKDTYTDMITTLSGAVVLACGGLNGLFPGRTTGTVANSGQVAATCMAQGLRMKNLEMIQYHPTTIGITGKCCLISEAARGEGGRLFILRDGVPWYFMEELYPERGNLMPRDVVSREMVFAMRRSDCEPQVYLDMTGLDENVWQTKLSDMRQEIEHYLGIDPAVTPVPVTPGIHYFMGGIEVDVHHRTSLPGLYAAGECACQYHGANRLGGNSMLGAMYGGRVVAEDIVKRIGSEFIPTPAGEGEPFLSPVRPGFHEMIGECLAKGLPIVRNQDEMQGVLNGMREKRQTDVWNARESAIWDLAEAMMRSAIDRKESVGAHYLE